MSRIAARIMDDITYEIHASGKAHIERLSHRGRADLFLFYKECLLILSRHSSATHVRVDVHAEAKSLIMTLGRRLERFLIVHWLGVVHLNGSDHRLCTIFNNFKGRSIARKEWSPWYHETGRRRCLVSAILHGLPYTTGCRIFPEDRGLWDFKKCLVVAHDNMRQSTGETKAEGTTSGNKQTDPLLK